MAKHTVTFLREDEVSGQETEIQVEVNWAPEQPNYFDRSWGNWLPGDHEIFEVMGAWEKGTHTEVTLTQREVDRLGENVESLLEEEEGDCGSP